MLFFKKYLSFKLGLILFVCISFVSSCKSIKSLGKHEKKWACTHPFAAIKLKKIKKECDIIYRAIKESDSLDKYENDGKLDAFRHMFYMAMFTTKVSPTKVRKLGQAHEKDNYYTFLKNLTEDGERPDSVSCAMDQLNNDIGIGLINSIEKRVNIVEVRVKCFEEINNGKAYFMKRDSLGNYLRCDGTIIDVKLYSTKWGIPKCLVQN